MNFIRSKVEVLSQQEMQMIHESSLKLLSTTGLSVPNERALKILQERGAEVDFDKEIARLPVKVMEAFVAGLREQGENSQDPVIVQAARGGVSTQIHLVDYLSGERRLGVMDDVKKGVALAPHLKNISGDFAVVVPSDVPSQLTDVESYVYLNTHLKEGGGTFILSKASGKWILEMSKVTGRRWGYLLETVAPLQYRREALEIALMFADAGEGLGLCPMVMAGATGPMTIAGTLTLNNAEVLASLFVNSSLTGRPCLWYGHGTHSMDMRSTLCSFGSASQMLFAIATTQLSQFYGITGGNNCALSDSLTADFQCGMEKAATLTMSMLSGGKAFGGQGIVGADQGFSFEQLVLDDEWLSYLNHAIKGVEVNAETIALELMQEVGIGGNFLSEDHTVAHMRDSYLFSDLFRRGMWSDARESWSSDALIERAHAFVEEHTRGYREAAPVVPEHKALELQRLLQRAYTDLGIQK